MKFTIFTLMPMFVCLFWSILLGFDLHKDGKNRPRLHLLVFFIVTTILYFGHYTFFNHNITIIPITDTLYCMANLAVYPLYFLYICSLATRRERWKLRKLLLLPSIFSGLAVGITYLFMSEAETNEFVRHYLYDEKRLGMTELASLQAFIHDICKIIFALLIFPVFFYGRNYIQQYEKLIKSTYADIEDKTLSSLHYMLIAFIATSISSFTVNIIGRQFFDDYSWFIAIPSLLFSILLFTIGYMGYNQHFSIEDLEVDEQKADNISSENLVIAELKERIEKLMEEEQLYRQQNLKIIDLVARLNTNRNYIYQAINREMGISFNEYVNRMRIEYAVMLMNQHSNMTLSEISEQAGFSSSTSFYRNFKLYKGIGPKEYQLSLKKKE